MPREEALRAALEYTAEAYHESQEQTHSHNGNAGATFRDCPNETCMENVAALAADGWSVVRTEDVERLRRVEAAARALTCRCYRENDAGDECSEHVALRAALGDPS